MDPCKEHSRCIQLDYPKKSALVQHSLETGFEVYFSSASVLYKSSGFWEEIIIESFLNAVLGRVPWSNTVQKYTSE